MLAGSLAVTYVAVDSLRWASEQSAGRIEREHGIRLPAGNPDPRRLARVARLVAERWGVGPGD